MAWITITTDDVKTRLSGPELTALQTVALSDGQSDPLPEIVSQVVDECRGYVAACASNTLGDGETIPEKLLGAALAMIRYRLATRLPTKRLLTDERVDENKGAVRLLERVADCKFAIEEPETPEADEKISSPKPSMCTRTRNFTDSTQDGI